MVNTESKLAELCKQLLRSSEAARVSRDGSVVGIMRAQIEAGSDPLGEAFIRLRSPEKRRALGAVYTPDRIVAAMVRWASEQRPPLRIVDPGAGSGRFLLAAADAFPKAQLVGIEKDPLAALILRANLSVRGLAQRAIVLENDYQAAELPPIKGRTLFIGNPPYVRHHQISASHKKWFGETAKALGLPGSKLAGLHIHFFVRTAQLAQTGDYGAFITSAEWLDVNYGATLRTLLSRFLGGESLH